VLDAELEQVPRGMAGELYIGGDGVGLGYVANQSLTDAHFLLDARQNRRLYRTGDRAWFDGRGRLRFLGRSDGQIKLRGYRIELGEIEAQLLRHHAVGEAAAVVQEYGPLDRRLVAFVRPKDHCTSDELMAWLRRYLPEHAVPGAINLRADLPLTAHGKLDRKLLASLQSVPGNSARSVGRDRTVQQQLICDGFATALARREVDIDDDLFELGGHSLLAVMLSFELSSALGMPVSVVDIFENPTPRQLASVLVSRASAEPEQHPLGIRAAATEA
jgi:nonribosomal peptide synthetase DhbF